jgi:hypothetical protein
MDVFKRLPRNNCRDCGFPTCMAFAAMLVQGQAESSQCPSLDSGTVNHLAGVARTQARTLENRRDELMEGLRAKARSVDFQVVAPRLDASVSNGRFVVRCLGKKFELDEDGNLHSDCHINGWVHLPILNYAVHGQGLDMTGEWVTFGELKNAQDWHRFFAHRCEKGLQEIVEKDPDLFFDAMDMFTVGQREAGAGEVVETADYVTVLHPLPKVPLLIAFWKAEDEFDAKLSLLFDRSAESNLGAESIYLLVMGLLEMIKRIMARHGCQH